MFIYRILSTIIFFALLPIYAVIRALKGKFLPGWKEKLGYFNSPELENKVIMFHGVSVGEVIALENLIKKTKDVFPDYKIVVTTGTKTGQEIARKKFDNLVNYITYFPFDIPCCVKLFLKKINPSIVLIAETELWPNFAYGCYKNKIPLYVINGRISDSTFKSYKFLKIFFKQFLKFYTKILTQSNDDKEKFINIGASSNKVKVMNNLKFDIKKPEADIHIKKGNNKIIIAGSTHKGEDEIILNTFCQLKKEFSNIKLILAPRHLTRLENIKELVGKTGLKFGYRSQNHTFENFDIILLDTMGELSKMYSVCDFAFIGGSFNKTGGHNPLEAIVFDKPVISGPSVHNFRDIYRLLECANAGKVVKTPQELYQCMQKLLSDETFYNFCCQNCKNIFETQQGALQNVINELKTIL